ncbi:hypothetical protein M3Y94_01066300 [Aphelenchoides besseyi]|nr:hypothetical protein M3Y94_01066300 [Aphelenchoides besseyi]KAI6216406.1 Ras family protein [Aphelenchoides besseyi]
MSIYRSFRRRIQEPPRRKIVLVGDGACGKTCLVMVFKQGIFLDRYIPTIFETYAVNFKLDNQPIELGVWDNAGQEGYERLRALSYRNTDVVLLCFGIDSPVSLENVKKWAQEVRESCPLAPIFLIGNKVDLRNNFDSVDEIPVQEDQAKQVAQMIGARAYIECSAQTKEGVNEVFELVARTAFAVNPKKKKVTSARCLRAIRRFARQIVGRLNRRSTRHQKTGHETTYEKAESIGSIKC